MIVLDPIRIYIKADHGGHVILSETLPDALEPKASMHKHGNLPQFATD